MNGDDWSWTVGLFLFALISYLLLNAATSQLITAGVIPLPESLPAILDPRSRRSIESLVGGQAKGNWSLALVSLCALLFNTFGEEFW